MVDILGGDTVLSNLDAETGSVLFRTIYGKGVVDSLLPGPGLDPDGRNIDETRSGSWLETTHLVHGRELGVVETLVRVSSFDNDVTLVKLQSDETVDSLLRGGDGGHDEFTFG